MRPITLSRALAWAAVAVTGWSLTIRWGDDPRLPGGPPGQWERHVVGALLLAGLTAVLLSLPAQRGAPSWAIRGLAIAASAGAAAIAFVLRSRAAAAGSEHMLAGPGFTWLVAGSGLALVAAASTAFIKAQAEARRAPSKRSRGRRA